MICQTNNGGCDQICTATNNSFECSCTMGYTLGSDNTTCDGMIALKWKSDR